MFGSVCVFMCMCVHVVRDSICVCTLRHWYMLMRALIRICLRVDILHMFVRIATCLLYICVYVKHVTHIRAQTYQPCDTFTQAAAEALHAEVRELVLTIVTLAQDKQVRGSGIVCRK